jgi:putative cell wall-binding protein
MKQGRKYLKQGTKQSTGRLSTWRGALLAVALVVSLLGMQIPQMALAVEGAPTATSSTAATVTATSTAASTAASLAESSRLATPSAGLSPLELTTMDTTWRRLAQSDRYGTMSAIVSESHAQSDVAILASGNDFPDALAASSLAGISQAPLLLTDSKSLSAEAAEKISSLNVKEIIIVGGPGSVSTDIENQLSAQLGAEAVSRLSGTDRYQTAYALYDGNKSDWGDTAIIAAGGNFADALSIAPYAYRAKAPIFLYDAAAGALDSATVAALKTFDNVLLVGGTGSIPDSIESQIDLPAVEDIENDEGYFRLWGSDRYQTSVDVALYGITTGVLDYENIALATGSNFPDALCGGTLCGAKGSVLLLVDDNTEGRYGIYLLVAYRMELELLNNGYLLGGTGTIPQALETSLNNIGKAKWEEAEVVRLVNAERTANSLPALQVDPDLQIGADVRAEEAVRNFDHIRPDGRDWSTIFDEIFFFPADGGDFWVGENLAYGQSTPSEVVTAWMASEGHRKNILDPDFTRIGVGYYAAGGTHYWSQLFAG